MSISNVTYNLPDARFHELRDDGVYVPIYIDGMADADFVERVMQEMLEEAQRLRANGKTVL